MPRRPRHDEPGAFNHVFARGNNRERVFRDDGDRQVYLVVLKGVIAVFDWVVHAYCLMDNHVHLVVETPHGDLSAGMHRLQGAYGQIFNWRHERSGHVFKRPFGSVPIRDERQLAAAIAYVEGNPVTARLCEEPRAWRWSSAAAEPAGCGSQLAVPVRQG